MTNFVANHINATAEDLKGNNGIGRYILLPGSDGRAKEIAASFNALEVKTHPRGHHLYLGTINDGDKEIAVATISTGMGCASMEIILHELFQLGATRFLRVGTAGSLQPDYIKNCDIINVQAAVRDEETTVDYAPLTLPATASFEFVSAINQAANQLGIANDVKMGTVHCKSSLYAREFGVGPRAEENKAYLALLTRCGVLASEMETSALFIQTQYYNHQLMQQAHNAKYRVICGAVLLIVGTSPTQAATTQEGLAVKKMTELAFEAIKILAKQSDIS